MDAYVVTGGAGFIGSHLVEALVRRGDRVRVVDDLSSGSLANLTGLGVGEPGGGAPVEFFRGSVADGGLLRAAMADARGVFHEAAQVSVPASVRDPLHSYQTNVMGTLNVLEAARAAGVTRVVFAASSAAYGDDPALPKVEDMAPRPLSPYASGKLAGEALLATWTRCFGFATAALRYFNVYGPRQADNSPYSGVIALFAKAVLARRAPTIFGDGSQTRDFVFVTDVVAANLLAMERVEAAQLYNVGTGASVSVLELYETLARLAAFDEPPLFAAPREGDVPHSRATIARARRDLGFEPRVELAEGLRRTLDWYRTRA
ncbi:MAG: NAD-dependent epimerase/dehydratase family protein [Planctomycetota bacterium]